MMKLFLISISLLICAGCSMDTSNNNEKKVQEELKRKIENYLLQKKEDCKHNAILEAEIYIDSVIYELSQFNILDDSIKMITRPYGPARPDYMEIKDTGAIVPFEIDSLSQKATN